MRLIGPNCLGILNTAPGRRLQRQLRPDRASRRQRRLRHPERRARPRPDRLRRDEEPRRLLLRLGRQSRRHHRQRPARVLGGRRAHAAGAALHRVLHQPAALRPGRATGRQAASPSSSSRADARRPGRARRQLPHRGAARRLGPHHRCALRAVGGDPGRDAGGDARRRLAALPPAAAGGAAGRHPHQRRRAGDHVRRHLRGGRSRGAVAPRGGPGPAARVPRRRGLARQPGRHDRDGDRRAVPAGDRRAHRAGTGSTR